MDELIGKEEVNKEQHRIREFDGSDEPDEVRDEFIERGVVYPTCAKRGKTLEKEMGKGQNPCDACPGREACHEGESPVREIVKKEEVDVRSRIMEDDRAWR